MGVNIDKQIVSTLDRLHHQVSYKPCRWFYDSKQDIYSCSHMQLLGKVVIPEVKKLNGWDL